MERWSDLARKDPILTISCEMKDTEIKIKQDLT